MENKDLNYMKLLYPFISQFLLLSSNLTRLKKE